MASVTIDGTEYELDQLNDNARAQLQSIQLVDQKLAELQSQAAVYQTARGAYAAALKGELSKSQETDDEADSSKKS